MYQVKMPLLRVAHPSEEQCAQELDRLKSKTETISTKGVRQPPDTLKNPLLFDFEHNYDPQLTPRRNWQQKVVHLEAKLEQTSEKLSQE